MVEGVNASWGAASGEGQQGEATHAGLKALISGPDVCKVVARDLEPSGMAGTVTALIVDDHQLFRGGLKLLLQDMAGVGQVFEVGSLDEAHEAIASGLAPDLVTFDLNMPGLSGLEGLSALQDALPGARFVVVSASEAREDILGALGAGAHGYVPKSLPAAEVADAIGQVLAGRLYAPRALQRAVSETPKPAVAESMAPLHRYAFTNRQRNVVDLLLTGASTRKIAGRLGLAEGTVKIHLAAIYRLLGVNSRAEVIARLK